MIEDLLSHRLSKTQESFLRKSTQGVTIASILFVGPFVIYDLFAGKVVTGVIGLFMLAIVSYTAWNTLAGRLSYKLPFVFLTPAFIAFSWVSIPELGVIGVLWSYPTIIIFYFIFPERLARVANIAALAFVLPLTLMEINTDIALRITATLLGVSILCAVFVRRLNSQQIELEEMATRDSMTQLSNRLNLYSTLDTAIEFSGARGYPMSILLLDLDGFRRINSRFGYEAGDQVLQKVGGLLSGMALSSNEIFRMGGEEFLILLNGSDNEVAKQQATRIHAAIKQIKIANDTRITVSIGTATLKRGENRYDLLNRVDANLHKAKQAGGDCTQS